MQSQENQIEAVLPGTLCFCLSLVSRWKELLKGMWGRGSRRVACIRPHEIANGFVSERWPRSRVSDFLLKTSKSAAHTQSPQQARKDIALKPT